MGKNRHVNDNIRQESYSFQIRKSRLFLGDREKCARIFE